MKAPQPVTIDFETLKIEGRPFYPPVPVGVSIKLPKKQAKYYAWGHPSGNNCSWGEGEKALKKIWRHKDGLLFQNGKFDLDVAEEYFELPIPEWDKVHDTMFLLYLDDPDQLELGLKPSAERLLNLPPEEQDLVGEYLLKEQPIPGVKISKSKKSAHYFGAYIAYAPGDLVGKYADGDTIRTEKLFHLLWKKTQDRQMLEAYDRERKLMPILLSMERQGLPVDLTRLHKDVVMYTECLEKIDAWVIKKIKAEPDINLDSGQQLIAAMVASKKVDVDKMPLTATGKLQTNKDALLLGVTDKVLLGLLKYRAQLKTCLNTFMKPWLLVAEASNGYIYTTWNQIKSPKGDSSVGTRTGRLSSNPNFQNIPKGFKPIFHHDNPKLKLPKSPIPLPPLPKVRSYVVPFKGEVFIDRDYSQQEPRILAHFDGGALLDRYLEDPWIDLHDYAKAELELMGKFYERGPVKNTNLGLIYGMGAPKLAIKNDMTVEESKTLKAAVLQLYPGLKEMYREMKQRYKANLPIRTWGGREYYCEQPKMIKGRLQHFDYKMVNKLIQGSAADCTKEAIIRFDEHTKKLGKTGIWKPLLNVHDQITVSVPTKEMHEAMEVLRQDMESIEFDVPMLSEGSYSKENWASLVDYDKKGKRL